MPQSVTEVNILLSFLISNNTNLEEINNLIIIMNNLITEVNSNRKMSKVSIRHKTILSELEFQDYLMRTQDSSSI